MTDDKLSPGDGDVDPSGEHLSAELSDPGEYELSPDETEAEELENADEELDDTPFEGDADEVVIDDPEQLAEAEGLAAKARSSRPVKRTAQIDDASTVSKASRRRAARAAAAGDDEPDADDTDAPDTDAKPTAKGGSSKGGSSTSSTTKSGSAKSTGKTTVTRKGRASSAQARKRTTPVQFAGQSVAELKKVNWPTGDQLRQYFIVVLVFVVLIIAFVGLLDLAFGWGLLKLLGTPSPTTPPQ